MHALSAALDREFQLLMRTPYCFSTFAGNTTFTAALPQPEAKPTTVRVAPATTTQTPTTARSVRSPAGIHRRAERRRYPSINAVKNSVSEQNERPSSDRTVYSKVA